MCCKVGDYVTDDIYGYISRGMVGQVVHIGKPSWEMLTQRPSYHYRDEGIEIIWHGHPKERFQYGIDVKLRVLTPNETTLMLLTLEEK